MNILVVLTSHDRLGDTGQNPALSEPGAEALLALLKERGPALE